MTTKTDKPKNQIHVNEPVITADNTRAEIEAQKSENAARLANAHEIANKAKTDESEEAVSEQEAARVEQERIEALSAEFSAKKFEDADADVKVEPVTGKTVNADGLIPGAPVDFETLMRIESSRTAEERAKAIKNLQVQVKK